MGWTKGQKLGRPQKDRYDAYVLYYEDRPIGVFDTRQEIMDLTGYSFECVRRWGQGWYKKRWYEMHANGERIKCPYLVEPVTFDDDDW